MSNHRFESSSKVQKPKQFGAVYAVLVSTALATNMPRVHADSLADKQVALVWRAPADAECSSGEQIQTKVARLTDVSLTLHAQGAQHRIEADVYRSANSWAATLAIIGPRVQQVRQRTVQGRTPSCGSIDVAAAVVIATMLDSLRADTGASQPTASTSADGGRLRIRAFAAASPELIPGAWLGGGLGFELGTANELAFSASAYAPAEHTDSNGRGARLWGLHAGGALCPALVRSDLVALRVCAGAQAGAVSASGVGLNRGRTAWVPMLLLQAGPKLTFEVTRTFAVQLAAAAAWVVVRPRITWSIEDDRAPPLSGGRIALLTQIGITISPW